MKRFFDRVGDSIGFERYLLLGGLVWLVLGVFAFLVCCFLIRPMWPYYSAFLAMAIGMFLLAVRTTRSRPKGSGELVGQGENWSDAGLAYQRRVSKVLMLEISLFLVCLAAPFVAFYYLG